VIAAGRAATALAVLLERAGHRVVAASGREGSAHRAHRYLPRARFLPLDRAAEASAGVEVVLLGAPDDAVGELCGELASAGGFSPGQHVVHLAGSLGLDVLDPAARARAEPLSVHPLQSFPTVERGVETFPGSWAAVTARTERGATLGEGLVRDAGGIPFRLAEADRPLYHAAAVFCANYLVTVVSEAERLLRGAGLADPLPRLAPLARAALEWALAQGPEARGDAGTVRRNLEALASRAPEGVAPYVALGRLAAGLAAEAGRLSEQDRERVEEALSRWR
jgi:predicted short-subunit dehydrogenase-like oxidoreductase (DUF2520 family)